MPGRAWPRTAGAPLQITSQPVQTTPRLVIQPLEESLPPVSATGTFDQSASWAGSGSELIAGAAAFDQIAGLSGAVVLKIMGYASPEMPEEFSQATGIQPGDIT